jgi:signal transduction histidine kinase/DNA-binding response OmpR family regulator
MTNPNHPDQSDAFRNSRPGLIPSILFFVTVAVLLGIAGSGLIFSMQLDIARLASDTHDRLLPTVLEQQRSAVNLERLGRFGEIILSTEDARERREKRLAAQVLAQDTAFESDPNLHKKVWEAFEAIRNIAALRDAQDALRRKIDQKLVDIDLLIGAIEQDAESRDLASLDVMLKNLYALRSLSAQARLSRSMGELLPLEAKSRLLTQSLQPLEHPSVETLQPEGGQSNGLHSFEEIFGLQEAIIQNEAQCMESWTRARALIEGLADPLTTDAAVTAANRITSIAGNAKRAMAASTAGLGAMVLVIAVLTYFAWRNIVIPIMQVTRGLERVQAERVEVRLPRTRVKELEAIRIAAEKFGRALLQIADHARELEAANEALALENAERRRAEAELARARDAAEAGDRAKSEFLASMSHEIRTPLTAILGMSDLLWESELSEDQRQYVQISKSAGENLLNIINDILDLSKVEAGQIELEAIEFNLYDLIDRTCKVLAVRAHEKGLEVSCHVTPDAPANLVGDPTRLRQVLFNLIGNAIKFTEKGEVAVRVEPEPGSAEPGAILFSVRDTGIGIPSDKLELIFETFAQVDSSTTRKYGGTGLGLSISRKLASLMGGKLWVESAPSHGSTFFFTARFETRSAAYLSSPAAPVELRELRALIVDDNVTNLLILREQVASWGARVTVAENGKQALFELNRAIEESDPFELVLLDCRMPGMDGLQVAEHIRANRTLGPPLIMMLTSDDRIDHRARVREIGLAAYLVKPVNRQELLEAILAALGKGHAKPEDPVRPASSLTAADFSDLSILLVEDNASNRRIIRFYLEGFPFQVDIAENGKEAVDKVIAGSYDLVLLDMRMPVMDGYEAAGAIRDREKKLSLPPMPIIALTAHAFKEDRQKCLNAGCTEYLTKPIRRGELLRTLHKLTTGRKLEAFAGLPPEPAVEPEGYGEVLQTELESTPRWVAQVDSELKELIPFFMEDSYKELSAMQTALEHQDFETLQRLGHSIKGSSRNYGFDALGEIGAAIETSAKTGAADEIKHHLNVLSDFLERVEVKYV